jgi:hypothetical protein
MRVNRYAQTPSIAISPSIARIVRHSVSPRIVNSVANTIPAVTEDVIFDGEKVYFDGEKVVK